MTLFILQWLLILIIATVCLFLFEWIAGRNRGTSREKRSIKEKSIIQSWLLLVIFFITNAMVQLFNNIMGTVQNPIPAPHLFYFIVAMVSYFLFYFYYLRKAKKQT